MPKCAYPQWHGSTKSVCGDKSVDSIRYDDKDIIYVCKDHLQEITKHREYLKKQHEKLKLENLFEKVDKLEIDLETACFELDKLRNQSETELESLRHRLSITETQLCKSETKRSFLDKLRRK